MGGKLGIPGDRVIENATVTDSLDKLLSVVQDLTTLKHIVLRAEMYTIEYYCLLFIPAPLTSLEHFVRNCTYRQVGIE